MRLKLYTSTKHEFDDKFSRHSLTFLRRNFQRIFKDYSRVENYLKLLIYLEPKPRLRNATYVIHVIKIQVNRMARKRFSISSIPYLTTAIEPAFR